jgi:hypothetical protein
LFREGGDGLTSIEDLESPKIGTAATDRVIHLAFVHDFNNFARSAAIDQAASEAMSEVMAGRGKPLIIASGTLTSPKANWQQRIPNPSMALCSPSMQGSRTWLPRCLKENR